MFLPAPKVRILWLEANRKLAVGRYPTGEGVRLRSRSSILESFFLTPVRLQVRGVGKHAFAYNHAA